ncbi:MAG TPA: endo-1,4-beta-xylanase [Prosthecobacter sp.]|nr:endo-1,4-beta-xylanase [Prosthecobacter sp.]
MILRLLTLALVIVASVSLAEVAASQSDDLPLRLWAQRRDVQFGTAVDAEPLREDARYRALAKREFSMLTPADAMKMGPLRPARDRFLWSDGDALVQFAESNAQRVHGHTLVWHGQLPAWVESQSWTRDELLSVLREHVSAVVTRYKGRVQVWDVVNEAFEDDGTLRQSVWQRIIGPEYIEHAFRWAHEIDPEAVLLYNDYSGEDLGKKSDAIYELLRDLKIRGVPVHGVGLQMHITLGKLPSPKDLEANLRRLADLGLELHVTEADVRMPVPATAEALAEQAKNYHQLLRIALEFPQLRSWTIWGFSDRHSWVPRTFKGYGAALPWDENYEAKPARDALRNAHRGISDAK